MTLEDFATLFAENADSKFNVFNKKISNTSLPTFGCTVPFIRSVAKQYSNVFDEIMLLAYNVYYEIDMLKGIAIAQAKIVFDKKRPLINDFVQHIESWAICDVSIVKVPVAEKQQYFNYFADLTTQPHPFVVRYGIVSLLSRFLDQQYIDRIFNILQNVVYGSYYVDMAVAWLIATAVAKCPTQAWEFLEGSAREKLNAFSYNKALQKIRESNRVSLQDKQRTYQLKRSD